STQLRGDGAGVAERRAVRARCGEDSSRCGLSLGDEIGEELLAGAGRVDPQVGRHRAGDGVALVDPYLPVVLEEVDPGDTPDPRHRSHGPGQVAYPFLCPRVDLGGQFPSRRDLSAPGQVLLVVAVDPSASVPGRRLDRRQLQLRVRAHGYLEV